MSVFGSLYDYKVDPNIDENFKKQVDIESVNGELVSGITNDVVKRILSLLSGVEKTPIPEVCKSWYLEWLRNVKAVRKRYPVPFSPCIIKCMSRLTILVGFSQHLTNDTISNLLNLTKLDLSFNKFVDDQGLVKLKRLVWLGLERQELITDEGIMSLPNITTLNLNDNHMITKKTIDHFASQLTRLSLFGNSLLYDVLDEEEMSREREGDRIIINVRKVLKPGYPMLKSVSWGFEPEFYRWTREESS